MPQLPDTSGGPDIPTCAQGSNIGRREPAEPGASTTGVLSEQKNAWAVFNGTAQAEATLPFGSRLNKNWNCLILCRRQLFVLDLLELDDSARIVALQGEVALGVGVLRVLV